MLRAAIFAVLLLYSCGAAERNYTSTAVQDLFLDEYNHIYRYDFRLFTLTKTDSAGRKLAQVFWPQPFRLQDVQNPLRVVAFSENAQEVRFYDRHLNETEAPLKLSGKFNFIKAFYSESRENTWLIDGVENKILHYSLREEKILNTWPINEHTKHITDFIVFRNQAYVLTPEELQIYSLTDKDQRKIPVSGARKIRREGSSIFILKPSGIFIVEDNSLKSRFVKDHAQIVDKNNRYYLALIDNKFYLYPIENIIQR